MKHIDLFSGIGGFALAAQNVWRADYEPLLFCDSEDYCQRVLEKHWPNAPIYGDVRTLTKARYINDYGGNGYADLLTGGFPCQPFSIAGRRRGTEDNRFLWPDMLRVIREFRPRWIIAENVRGLLSQERGMAFEQVCADVEGLAYAVQAFVIPAAGVGAPHRRDRVWIVAYANHGRQQREIRETISQRSDAQIASSQPRRGSIGGNSLHRQSEDAPHSHHSNEFGRSSGGASNGFRMEADIEAGKRPRREPARCAEDRWSADWLEVAACLCRMDDGVPGRMDRTPRLQALGNAIVPQVAEEIMKAIKETEARR